jgi:hypothetical protein
MQYRLAIMQFRHCAPRNARYTYCGYDAGVFARVKD